MKKLDNYIVYIILLISIISFFAIFINRDSSYSGKMPVAKKGVLDLNQWDFIENGSLRLNGEWEFYYKELLSYEDFRQKENTSLSSYIHVPGKWEGYEIEGSKIDMKGYGTYRLRVDLNKDTDLQMMGIRIPYRFTSYNLMIDEELIASKDRNDNTVILETKNIFFEPKSKSFNIILQVPGQDFYDGGTHIPLYLGDYEDIIHKERNDLLKDMMLLACLAIMGLYHISLYVFLKRMKYILYFGLLCMSISLRSIHTNEALLISNFLLLNFRTFHLFNVIGGMLNIIFFGSFIYELYFLDCSKKILRSIQAYCVAMILITVLLPYSIYGYLRGMSNAVLVIAALYYFWVILKAAINKREGAYLMVFAMAIMVLSVINDVLYVSNIASLSLVYGMTTYSTIIYVFVLALLLSKKYADTFLSVDSLSKKLLSLDKLKDDFLANTSHELRTPLNGIIGITESLIEGAAGKISEEMKRNLTIISASGKRLSNLVNDILDYSKLKHSDIKLSSKPLNLYQLVDIVMTVFKMTKQNDDIVLKNEVAEDIPYIYADEARLQQIMYNLIGNAIKFTEEGEITVAARVVDNSVEITVKDMGIGIAEDKLEAIFESFEQIDGSTSRPYSGTGLGLSITKKLVELHEGNIRCESTPGKGSSFIFTLPISNIAYSKDNSLQAFDRQVVFEEAAISYDNYRDNSKANILVVDDEQINIQVLVNQLSLKNYHVVSATNGEDALKLIAGIDFDLVILDAMMPKMSGYEVCKKIREKHTLIDLPILILTANNQLNNICLAFECGTNDYVTKPFEKQELLARIKTLITMKNAITQSIKDPLTGIYNRKHVFELAELNFEQHKKEGEAMAVIMIDIDNFKEINDTYGHAVGDDILIEVVSRCKQVIRETDLFGRYGGEEFLIILPNILFEDAVKLAERIKNSVSSKPIVSDEGEEIYITVSLGITMNDKETNNIHQMLLEVDRALYKAKRNGKNRVEVA